MIQSYDLLDEGIPTALLGAVGQLQFEVVVYRLKSEYGAEPRLEPAPFTQIRWVAPTVTKDDLRVGYLGDGVKLATDVRGQLVVLFPDKWSVNYFTKEHAKIELFQVSPHQVGTAKTSPKS